MYRKKIAYFNIALFSLYILFFCYRLLTDASFTLDSVSDFVPVIAFVFFLYLYITYLSEFSRLFKTEKELANNELLLNRQSGEIAAKDALLAREKEILLTKHEQLMQALERQKKINLDNEKLRRNYEKIISLNNSVWFMHNPLDIIEEICQNSVESTNASRCFIAITNNRGEVEYCGSSLATAEEKKVLQTIGNTKIFVKDFVENFLGKPFKKMEKGEFSEELFSFINPTYDCEVFVFPIRFRNSFRGAAFYAVENPAKFVSENLVTAEMFHSILSVYFERNELIKKEFELDTIISEKEKLGSINNLIEGIAHNLNSPLNTISLSQEMNNISLTMLKEKYPEEATFDNLLKASVRISKAAAAINGIISNFTQKSMLDKKEKYDCFSINDMIRNEIVFLEADMSFKHKFQKETILGENIPAVLGLYRDFSYLFEAYVFIVMYFLADCEEKKIVFKTSSSGENVFIELILPKAFDARNAAEVFNDSGSRYISGHNISNVKATRDKYHITVKIFTEKENIIIRAIIPAKREL